MKTLTCRANTIEFRDVHRFKHPTSDTFFHVRKRTLEIHRARTGTTRAIWNITNHTDTIGPTTIRASATCGKISRKPAWAAYAWGILAGLIKPRKGTK